jgi:anaerobic magnesium-protoporphyrin IX monomethyl ester cyclase
MIKIMLLNPPMRQADIYSSYGKMAPVLAPLGICYIAAVLEKNDYDVRIIDSVAEKISKNEVIRRIGQYQPDIVGMTSTTASFCSAAEVAGLIKTIHKNTTIVLGGPHISSLPRESLLDCDSFDIGVFGEGEYTFLEIAENYRSGSLNNSLERIKGISYRSNGRIFVNEPRPLMENLDELPYPARHLLPPLNLYRTNLSISERKPLIHMIPSRGCIFQCIFCDQNVYGRRWRSFSPEYIIREIESVVEKYGVKTIHFQDDLFTCCYERAVKFCNLLKEKKFDLTWNISSRIDTLNGELLKIMKDAGCRMIYFGIESGDENILEIIKKGHTVQQVKTVVNAAKKIGLIVHGSFIIGNPAETKCSIEKTIKFALALPLDAASFFIMVPYPNTELARLSSKYGNVKSFRWTQYRGHPEEVIFLPYGLKSKWLLKKQKDAYRKFYFRIRVISNILKQIKRLGMFKLYLSAVKALLK